MNNQILKDVAFMLIFLFVFLKEKVSMNTVDTTTFAPIKNNTVDLNNYFDRKAEFYVQVTAEIGSYQIPFNLGIDLTCTLSWIVSENCSNCDFARHKLKSNTLNNSLNIKQINEYYGEVVGTLATDRLVFSQERTSRFSFVLVTEGKKVSYPIDGMLCLGKNTTQEEYNDMFFPLLLSSNSDLLNSFRIVQDSSDKRYGNTLTLNKKGNPYNSTGKPFCSFVNSDVSYLKNSWCCRLKYILINRKGDNDFFFARAVDHIATFDTNSVFTIAPLEIMQEFRKEYFFKYLNSKMCTISHSIEPNFNGFLCKKQIELSSFPVFHFILNGFAYKLDPESLFEYDESIERYFFKIVFRQDNEEDLVKKKVWTIGIDFIKNYNLFYNFDEKAIFFDKFSYNFTKYTTDNMQNNTVEYVLFVITISVLLFCYFCSLLCFFKYKRKKLYDDYDKELKEEIEKRLGDTYIEENDESKGDNANETENERKRRGQSEAPLAYNVDVNFSRDNRENRSESLAPLGQFGKNAVEQRRTFVKKTSQSSIEENDYFHQSLKSNIILYEKKDSLVSENVGGDPYVDDSMLINKDKEKFN